MTRPSNLGAWAACARHQWGREVAGVPRIPEVATWVGTAVHAMLAEKAFPPEPAYMHYDSTTPNLIVAVGQVSEIASAVREQLAAQGMVPVQWEIETIKGFCPGTIDVLLMRDGREPILGDVKTGVTIGAGAWLQLGAYFDSYQQTFPNTRFPLMPDPRRVAVIHAPRPKFGALTKCTIEIRDGEACMVEAEHWAEQANGWADNAHDWHDVPASPGIACSSCELRRECEVAV